MLNADQRAFFAELPRASRPLGTAWYAVLVLRAVLPALLALATGWLVGAVAGGGSLLVPLLTIGGLFTLVQLLGPLHQALSTEVGHRLAEHLNDRLLVACLRPDGIAHLENPELAGDLAVARDFDLGMTGPPLHVSMDFIADGLILLGTGVAASMILFGFRWWAPLVLLATWSSTHWLLRESGVWKDRNTAPVRQAQQHAEYAYRLAVDPPAAKEVRLFGLGPWVLDRFRERRRQLHALQYEATRLRERSVLAALAVVSAGNALVFWAIADAALDGGLSVARTIVFLQAALGASAIAFGGLNWALDGAAAPVGAVARIEGALRTIPLGTGRQAPRNDAPEIRFEHVGFTYPGTERSVLDGFDLTIPAGTSMAIVGVNGAGKTTAAKLLCRLYDPGSGRITIDGTDLRELDLERWRHRTTAVFQDYLRLEWTLRDNVDPAGRLDREHGVGDELGRALRAAGADGLAELDTVLAKGYPGGTDLSGGQWQRVALARTLGAVAAGARVVLLDEPTAQLDVRGEAEIFERVLAATRHCTTILVSHRFQTVRRADRICVLEGGRVVELGSHDELMAHGGRYRTMFDLQASRFVELDPETGEELVHDTL